MDASLDAEELEALDDYRRRVTDRYRTILMSAKGANREEVREISRIHDAALARLDDPEGRRLIIRKYLERKD